jgi:N-acetylglucosaminyldiphosphoundecaprenol N-acetyl-beta-D-mannosaminyltransferase
MGPSDRIRPVALFGVVFDNVTRGETVDLMEQFIAAERPRLICTPNADHLVQIRTDTEFRELLAGADLVVADGMGIVYASRILGRPFRENVGGRLILSAFAERAAVRGYRIFLLGGRSAETAAKAARRLCALNPGLQIAGTYTPPFAREFDAAETARMIEAVRASAADVLFVCLGTPKQEKWIARHLASLPTKANVGVGAALDMLAGDVIEPPRWMSTVGLEWLWKLASDPRRMWRRYIVNGGRFCWWVLRERMRQGRGAAAEAGPSATR